MTRSPRIGIVGDFDAGNITHQFTNRACADLGLAVEDFYCNYGVNAAYRNALEAHGLSVSGMGHDGEIRIVELRDHPFFMATLFLPQARSSRATPHPVLLGYAAALSSKPK